MDADKNTPEEIPSEEGYNRSRICESNIRTTDEECVISNKYDEAITVNRSASAENVHYNTSQTSDEFVSCPSISDSKQDCPSSGLERTYSDFVVRDLNLKELVSENVSKDGIKPVSQRETESTTKTQANEEHQDAGEPIENINRCSNNVSESFLEPSKIVDDRKGFQPRNQVEDEPKSEKKTDAQNEKFRCRDSLSVLARSYEDTEPVYLSGIVDHITRSGENEFDRHTLRNEKETERDQIDEEGLSVTSLMSNESINDVFDNIYVINSRRPDCSEVDIIKSFQPIPVHLNDPENELTSSSSSSAYSDIDGLPKIKNTKIKSNLKRTNDDNLQDKEMPCKKARRGITFDSVSVYYFPRTQGFTCIPSQGGSTLGMSWNHSHTRKFSLVEHAAEQRRAHKQYCLQQFNAVKNWNELSNMSSEDSDSDEIISDSEVEFENYNFLQPIPTRERRAMLRAAGIHKIDSSEKDECRSIRSSREFCGCTCQIYCDPDRCVCAQAGIKCQVDRMNFPCSCTRDGCANENGRVEFNPVRVRTHYIHTLMRLDMEKKQEDEEQRSRSLMSNDENSAQLPYSSSSSSSSSSSPLNINSNLMNFSYHTNLQTWGGEYAGSITSAANCFNFGGYAATADHFSLGSMVDSPYQSISRLAVASSSPTSSLQYCGQLSSEESDECSRMLRYSNVNSSLLEMDQNFLIHDLTNSSKSNESDLTYNTDSPTQVTDKTYESQVDGASQSETIDTSAEVSEETEKEESDSENFGDIIKKTMVESVIA